MRQAKITEEMVIEVCELLTDGCSMIEILKRFDISRSTLYKIRTDPQFSHITSNYERLIMRPKHLPDSIKHDICRMIEEGVNNTDIMKKFRISNKTINGIRKGELFREISENYNIDYSISRQIPDAIVHQICERLQEGHTNLDIASMFKVDKDIVSDIKDGTSYSEISKLYNIEKAYRKGKITDDVMEEICKMRLENTPVLEISKRLNVGKTAVYRALKIEKFASIREKYGIE